MACRLHLLRRIFAIGGHAQPNETETGIFSWRFSSMYFGG